jgi:phosphodiesterase/alkaline phosphatase D-like protein
VFDVIRRRDPLFFLHMGDLHYRDIDEPDLGRYLRAFDEALASPAQARLYRAVPVAYIWDDHDYGPNDADRTADGRPAAHAAFREVVPRHPLALAGAEAPIARAFTIGRVRFVLTDLRSARSPDDLPPSRRTMLGAEQRRWLEAELVEASRTHALVIWVSSVPWLGGRDEDDTWGGYPEERRALSDLIVRAGVRNLAMVSGDAHMLAIDDGRHNRFATGGDGPGFPIFQAAALDRGGSTKGGPYSSRVVPGGGQFGEMDIEDDGDGPVTVTWRGRDAEGRVLVAHAFEAGA